VKLLAFKLLEIPKKMLLFANIFETPCRMNAISNNKHLIVYCTYVV